MRNGKGVTLLTGAISFILALSTDVTLIASVSATFIPEAGAAAKSFYEGKTITIVAPSNPGGGYDLYARLLMRHMGKYIPGNPKFVIQNMDGAGGLIAANHVYNRVKPDGLTFMIFNHAVITRQLAGDPDVLLDVRKMRWIGTASDSPNMCVVRNDAKYQRIEDMIGAKEPTILGATPSSTREYFPKMLNEVLGTNFKVIVGYRSGGSIYVGIESRELDGTCGVGWDTLKAERPHWFKENYAHIFLQLNPIEKAPDLPPNTPWIMDYVKKPADRQLVEAGMGTQAIVRSFTAPPGVPNDRIEILRKAFDETMRDKAFLADAARTQSIIKPRTGPEVEAFIKRWFSLPRESIEKIRQIYFPAGFK